MDENEQVLRELKYSFYLALCSCIREILSLEEPSNLQTAVCLFDAIKSKGGLNALNQQNVSNLLRRVKKIRGKCTVKEANEIKTAVEMAGLSNWLKIFEIDEIIRRSVGTLEGKLQEDLKKAITSIVTLLRKFENRPRGDLCFKQLGALICLIEKNRSEFSVIELKHSLENMICLATDSGLASFVLFNNRYYISGIFKSKLKWHEAHSFRSLVEEVLSKDEELISEGGRHCNGLTRIREILDECNSNGDPHLKFLALLSELIFDRNALNVKRVCYSLRTIVICYQDTSKREILSRIQSADSLTQFYGGRLMKILDTIFVED